MASFTRCPVARGYHIRAQVRRKGRSWSGTFKTKKAAAAWARSLEISLDAGHGAAPASKHTLQEMVDRFAATVLPEQKGGRQVHSRLRRWIDILGDRPLVDIAPRDLAEARDALAALMSAGSVRRYLSALSAAFNRAIKDWQWLDTNPVRAIIWPEEPRGRVRYLSMDELAALRSACRRRSGTIADLVDLALLTGMRRGELMGLRWSSVDWDHSRVLLLMTKNKERRQVPLPAPALALLKARSPITSFGSALIFCRRGHPDKPQDVRTAWAGSLHDAGIKNFRFHDLRHTAASYLAMTGATSNQIAEILGHKTLAMVKRYAHLSIENQAGAIDRLSEKLLPGGINALP